ncbi:MAG: sodium:calcium exchanger [Coleofasciculaceae cyanobacterium SM2_3_26]|nr:sodium:calcium exchanger [Coleofasciculaceae cyanobacterium SM2_3_26]
MVADQRFVLDLTTVLGTSAIGGYIANRLRQPVLLGYLVSGLVVGPYGLHLLSEIDQIEALAQVGVAFLLFALGVEFSLAELKRVKDIAIQGSLLQILLTIALVSGISMLAGWVGEWSEGIFLGAILSLSSTAVVLKTLTERGEVNTIHGQAMLAILIAQDLALGFMLAILPALNQPERITTALLLAVFKVSLFLAGALIVGRWLIPPLMKQVVQTENSELFLLTVIALCLGVALITAALGLSIEMGAFVAGLTIAEIDYSDQALARILPLRDTFASLFFASVGMLIEPKILANDIGAIAVLVTAVMVGKAAIILPIVLRFGYSFKTALIVSFGLNQIGEFSFVLALEGLNAGLISENQYMLLLGTTAITLVLTPLWLRWSPRLAEQLVRVPALERWLSQFHTTRAFALPETIENHVVVAGYGRVGQVVVSVLQNRGFPVLVIENSEDAIQQLRQAGIPYIFGDADVDLVLEKAQLGKARAMAIALPDPGTTRLLVRRALEFAPELDIVARSHRNSEIDLLTQLGAREVVQPEFEAGMEMGAHVLATLGATRENIQAVLQGIRTDRYLSLRPELATSTLEKELSDAIAETPSQWFEVESTSPINGMTLAETNVRRVTGVTILAIRRGEETLYYPEGQTQLHVRDRLLVVGEREELNAFRDLLLEGRFTPEGKGNLDAAADRYWVGIGSDSPLIGMCPQTLSEEYSVGVQAIRRSGKLQHLVEETRPFQPGDALLLVGEETHIEGVKQLASSHREAPAGANHTAEAIADDVADSEPTG